MRADPARIGTAMKKLWTWLEQSFRSETKYRAFLVSVVVFGLGYGLYKGVIDNYLAEIVQMGEFDRGVSEFFREMPGLLLVFILAVFYTLSAETIYKTGSIIAIIGMGLHAVLPPSRVLVTVAVCILSLGDHIQFGMRSTIALQYSRQGNGGKSLGILGSANQIGTLAGYIVIIAAFSAFSGVSAYNTFFWIATAITAVGVIFAFRLNEKSVQDPTKRRFYFHKKYMKYYWLEVFYGARKQVFFTFGPYVLILFYGASASTISLLFAISAIVCFFASPYVGRLIDRVGYKPIMVGDTLILVIVCFFYGFAHHFFSMDAAFIICCVNYVLDSVISLASMASNVYVMDLSDNNEEMRATISTGLSVNHLITILIALFGGWIWKALGVETLFILSAVLGLANSAFAATIKTQKKA